MAGKREKFEDIVLNLRQVEVLQGQGLSIGDAVRQVGITQQSYYRWRRQYGGMSRDQLKRLKELEAENQRLRRAVSDLTLESASTTCGRRLAYPSAAPAARSDSIAPPSGRCRRGGRTKRSRRQISSSWLASMAATDIAPSRRC